MWRPQTFQKDSTGLEAATGLGGGISDYFLKQGQTQVSRVADMYSYQGWQHLLGEYVI